MKKFLLLLAVATTMVAIASAQQMAERRFDVVAGTAAVGSASTTQRHNFGAIKVYEIDWKSDSSGAAQVQLPILYGVILRASAVPSTSSAPTNGYGAVLADEDGVDLLSGKGAGLSSTTPTSFAPYVGDGVFDVPMTVGGTMTLNISGAGAMKSGKLVLYVRS